MYERNHYFGLDPIPIPKSKLADTVTDIVTDTETRFQGENPVTNFFYQRAKFVAKYEIFLDFFQAFKNLYHPKKWETWQKFEFFLIKKVLISERKVSAPIPKVDLGFGSRYWNLDLLANKFVNFILALL